ncbi:cytochrome c oxidase subunit 3 [Limibacter armeniacum]|uniref:cytochrome c oxidase subunit 3 n=1 Tax=Limibacter armeniacum TaxID=466084 RepID=UPI002FE69209
MDNTSIEKPENTLKMHPQKFALWIFIVSVVMMFGGFTSAYIVRQAEGNWDVFELPNILYVSTAVIILSSVTMHWAVMEARKDNFAKLKLAMVVTTVLGAAFLVLQFLGWGELVDINVYFSFSNPSNSFVYVLTGLHAIHVISAVIYLLVTLYSAISMKVHSRNMARIEMCATYWHFLDGLWVYLFLFMLLNR